MPIFFLVIGILLIVSAINNKTGQLTQLVAGDLTGSNGSESFIVWALALVVIGMIGYVKALKPVSNAFLALVLIVMVLRNGGFFDKFTQALESVK